MLMSKIRKISNVKYQNLKCQLHGFDLQMRVGKRLQIAYVNVIFLKVIEDYIKCVVFVWTGSPLAGLGYNIVRVMSIYFLICFAVVLLILDFTVHELQHDFNCNYLQILTFYLWTCLQLRNPLAFRIDFQNRDSRLDHAERLLAD